MKKIILILVIIAFAGCVSDSSDQTGITTLTEIDDRTLRLVGYVDGLTVQQIVNAIDENINTIVITSGGGEVMANIRLARLIRERGIRLEVADYCLSSCFNYLFLAAVDKTVQENSVLGFHGSVDNAVPRIFRWVFTDEIEAQRQFLADLDLDRQIYSDLAYKADKAAMGYPGDYADVDMFMVGREFFAVNNIDLDKPWFPANQQALNRLTVSIEKKYNRPLKMIGAFNIYN